MAFDYAGKAALAERLIEKFGRTVTLRQSSLSGDEWEPTLANSDVSITCVDLDQDVRNRAGELVEQGRRTLLVSTSAGVTPKEKDKVVIDTKVHEIDSVQQLAPGGINVLWKVILAR
jgi:hypothetical protein